MSPSMCHSPLGYRINSRDHIGQFDIPRSAAVERSKTSYLPTTNTLDSDFNKVISPRKAEFKNAILTRKRTQITPARPSPNATIGGQQQFRDSSKRRPGAIAAHDPKGAHSRSNEN